MVSAHEGRRVVPVALQLYSLRSLMADPEGFRGAIRSVGEMGYDGVQFASYGGLSAPEMRALLASAGVRPAGTHTNMSVLEGELDRELDYNGEIGNHWIFCPHIAPDRRANLAGWREVATSLNHIGERCRDRGFVFGYHNHDFELAPISDAPDRTGLDVLLGETDPALVVFEPDVYWIAKGDADPVAILRQYAGRIPIIHCKDMTHDDRRTYAPVGAGRLDWPSILDAADAGGVEWHCVEQDAGDAPMIDCVRTSITNLRSWGMGEKDR